MNTMGVKTITSPPTFVPYLFVWMRSVSRWMARQHVEANISQSWIYLYSFIIVEQLGSVVSAWHLHTDWNISTTMVCCKSLHINVLQMTNPTDVGDALTFHHEADICGFDWNVSMTVGWIAMKFGIDIYVPCRVNLNNFSDLLTSSSTIIRSKFKFLQYFGLLAC